MDIVAELRLVFTPDGNRYRIEGEIPAESVPPGSRNVVARDRAVSKLR
jgi:hypothetical protein